MLKKINIMARNTNCNTRKGAVKDRTQVLNPKTKKTGTVVLEGLSSFFA